MNKTIIYILFLSIFANSPLLAQHSLSLNVNLDGVQIDSIENRLVIKIKCINQDTIYIAPSGYKIFVPWLYNTIEFFEVKFDNYSISMNDYAAEVEKKGLFNENHDFWFIYIDNYPFNEQTYAAFNGIEKGNYSFIIKTPGSNFNAIGKNKYINP